MMWQRKGRLSVYKTYAPLTSEKGGKDVPPQGGGRHTIACSKRITALLAPGDMGLWLYSLYKKLGLRARSNFVLIYSLTHLDMFGRLDPLLISHS